MAPASPRQAPSSLHWGGERTGRARVYPPRRPQWLAQPPVSPGAELRLHGPSSLSKHRHWGQDRLRVPPTPCWVVRTQTALYAHGAVGQATFPHQEGTEITLMLTPSLGRTDIHTATQAGCVCTQRCLPSPASSCCGDTPPPPQCQMPSFGAVDAGDTQRPAAEARGTLGRVAKEGLGPRLGQGLACVPHAYLGPVGVRPR